MPDLIWKDTSFFKWRNRPVFVWSDSNDETAEGYLSVAFSELAPDISFGVLNPGIAFSTLTPDINFENLNPDIDFNSLVPDITFT